MLVTLLAATLGLPTRTDASTFKDRSLRDLIESSDLIVVGTITAIDESHGVRSGETLTNIELIIESVLRGTGASAGETFTLLYRGGQTADGLVEIWTGTPELVAGDKYLFFLRAEFHVSPFVPAADAVMRVVELDGVEVAVDRGGRLVRGSATLGLLRSAKLLDSLAERRTKKLAGMREAERAPAGMRELPKAADVVALIRRVAQSSRRAPRALTKAPAPRALPESIAPPDPPAAEPPPTDNDDGADDRSAGGEERGDE